jgi:sugar phosphate permease
VSQRWRVLLAGTFAQATSSAVPVGVIVLAPAIQKRFGLTLGQVGFLLGCVPAGGALSALAWGHLADRIGERLVIATGLSLSAVFLTLVTLVGCLHGLAALLILAGVTGSSVSAASGRAIMGWFPVDSRGMALAVRQAAVPFGGLTAALVLAGRSIAPAFLILAALNGVGAAVAFGIVRERPSTDRVTSPGLVRVLKNPRLLRLSAASALLSTGQVCIAGFAVVFLADAAGVGAPAAGRVLAAMQLGGVTVRIAVGRWSDRRRHRIRPMYLIALTLMVISMAMGLLTHAGATVLLPSVVIAGAIAMGWNALSFTAAAEVSGQGGSGTALGVQQTALGLWAFLAAPAFGAMVAVTSWAAGFLAIAASAAVSAVVLRPLREGEVSQRGCP